MTHDILIHTNSCFAEVIIDGVPVPGVTGYSIEHRAGQLPVLHLKVAGNMTIDSKMLTPVPEPWASFYNESAPRECGADRNQ